MRRHAMPCNGPEGAGRGVGEVAGSGLLSQQAITGHIHGSIRMTNIVSGSPVSIPQAGDHSGAVTNINVSRKKNGFITCSGDGTIKIFNDKKVLEAALTLEAPVATVCYLNHDGDILAGLRDKLIVIQEKVYAKARQHLQQARLAALATAREQGADGDALAEDGLLQVAEESLQVAGVLDEGSSDDSGNESGDSVRSEDMLEEDPQWGPRRPRCVESTAVLDAHSEEDAFEAAAAEGMPMVPQLLLEKTAKPKKRRGRRRKANKFMGDLQLQMKLGQSRNNDILLGIQEFKVAETLTSHIGFLPNSK
ncbi:hypothetical protein CYMTET_17267 [Cymbomonas tetramitiformis]|uniref:Uncharacterized protein n=1 Tax=Cymbomonas tetramitiformis TaxID=36881 RepID=A0AAE0L7F6_9CHLO|nr:hypothetical protein CYMTET_17267 [Cymbomonas tetramitiformis]